MYLNVSNWLKNERKRLNLTQKALAERLDVVEKSVSRWEADTPIPSDKLFALRDLGFDVNYLLTGNPSVPPLSAEEQLFLEKLRGANENLRYRALLLLSGVEPVSEAVGIVNSPNSQVLNSFNR